MSIESAPGYLYGCFDFNRSRLTGRILEALSVSALNVHYDKRIIPEDTSRTRRKNFYP